MNGTKIQDLLEFCSYWCLMQFNKVLFENPVHFVHITSMFSSTNHILLQTDESDSTGDPKNCRIFTKEIDGRRA